MMAKLLDWLGKLPTTQARVAVTLLIALGTAVRYFVGGWEPSWDWLAFIVVMSGLDLTQFGVKRTTDAAYVAAKQGAAAPPGPTP